jgi:hypothetical protein
MKVSSEFTFHCQTGTPYPRAEKLQMINQKWVRSILKLKRLSIVLMFAAVIARTADAAEVTELIKPTDNVRVIMIHGNLEMGDERDFIQVALSADRAIVLFNSNGGNLHAGIEIGKAIKLKQFYTGVAKDTYCASACAFAWLAGTKRFMEPTARVGFHAVYTIENGQPKTSGYGNALLGAYLNQLGLGTEAITYISNAAPENMQWLNADDASQYGINVELVDNPEPSAPLTSVERKISATVDSPQCYEIVGCPHKEIISEAQIQDFSCQNLWLVRNTIFHQRGYCFQTSRGRVEFDNSHCSSSAISDLRLSFVEKENIATLREMERRKNCQ